jgi:anti-sigma regulatory factor (Ser/Thr protein kinase)
VILVCSTAERLRLKFCSDITFVDYALEIIRVVAAYQGIQNSTDLLVVSHELLKNAVVHGNRNDRTKNVVYELVHLGGGRYRVVAQDAGEGFDRRGIAGRGLEIVGSVADKVRFSQKGNKISVLMRM